jgi:hypothetical protein
MRVERELSTSRGAKVVLFVEQPEKSLGRDEYSCRIGLEGAGIDASTRIYGIDAMQALLLSVRHLKTFVAVHSKSMHPDRLTWELAANETDFGLS